MPGLFNTFLFNAEFSQIAASPTYTYVTLQQAITALSARLYDETNQFWGRAELAAYISEALQTWNALTSFWRDSFTFPLSPSTRWYDITSFSNSLRPFTVQDTTLLQLCEYHLLEPLTPASNAGLFNGMFFNQSPSGYPLTWAGSRQFSLSDILGAITRRQNEVLGATGCTITTITVAAPTNRGIKAVELPDTTLDIRRVAWIPANNSYQNTVMRQSDIWQKRSFAPSYLPPQVNVPSQWIRNTDPQPGFNPDSIPPAAGNYECQTIQSGPVSNANSNQTMALPDDWCWVAKWGALGDLLSREGQAKDATRAAYCQKRFAEGMKLLAYAPATLGLEINGAYSLFPDAVRNGDDFNPEWQAQTPGPPSSCYQSGLNLIGFNPPDSNNTYTVTIQVVENSPIPTTFASWLQIARDDLDSVLDYAQHVAQFKAGGQEFTDTIPLLQNFMAHAAQYNRILATMGIFELPQEQLSQQETARNPLMTPEQATA